MEKVFRDDHQDLGIPSYSPKDFGFRIYRATCTCMHFIFFPRRLEPFLPPLEGHDPFVSKSNRGVLFFVGFFNTCIDCLLQ